MSQEAQSLERRHTLFGWWSLLVFLTLGLVLEALHGFKVGAYLDVDQSTRRLLWTLAHAHGTLLALVNLAFAATAAPRTQQPDRRWRIASWSLISASVLMPAGFLLGGWQAQGGDPGLGILGVVAGGLLLFLAVLTTAVRLHR
jgi:hypothetical protein